MHNVLIVDEEEHLLSALEQNLFPDRDDIAILTASDGEQGLEHLKNSRVDLLISDIKMPGKIDGFQLILRAKEVAPDARVIILTAFGSNRVQNFADRIGITHYIEKPFNTSELREAILEILDEREGFQGVLSDLELTDIIQMLCLARRTALLHLKYRDHRGRIVFDNGDVVHAEFDELLGEDAVYRMLALRQGDIFMQSDFQNDQQTIKISWQDLLLEGVRRADEDRADFDAAESYDDDSLETHLGMSGSNEELDDESPEIAAADVTMEDESFFSADELREIELASDPLDDVDLPFATLEDVPDPEPSEAASPSSVEDDFRSPFQRESSGLSAEINSQTRSAAAAAELSVESVQPRLETFARECPGMRQTAIVSADEGVPVASVSIAEGFDYDGFAALAPNVAHAAQHAIEALGLDEFVEMHVAVGDNYVLLQSIQGTGYLHVAVVDRHVSLGVALVLMRRLQRSLRDDGEAS